MSYEEEGRALMEECLRQRQEIIEKYAAEDAGHFGMDGKPSSKPLAEVSAWYQKELNELRRKYGLPIATKRIQ